MMLILTHHLCQHSRVPGSSTSCFTLNASPCYCPEEDAEPLWTLHLCGRAKKISWYLVSSGQDPATVDTWGVNYQMTSLHLNLSLLPSVFKIK